MPIVVNQFWTYQLMLDELQFCCQLISCHLFQCSQWPETETERKSKMYKIGQIMYPIKCHNQSPLITTKFWSMEKVGNGTNETDLSNCPYTYFTWLRKPPKQKINVINQVDSLYIFKLFIYYSIWVTVFSIRLANMS